MKFGGVISILALFFTITLARPIPSIFGWLDELLGSLGLQDQNGSQNDNGGVSQWLLGGTSGIGSGSGSGSSNYTSTGDDPVSSSSFNSSQPIGDESESVGDLSGHTGSGNSTTSGPDQSNADRQDDDNDDDENDEQEKDATGGAPEAGISGLSQQSKQQTDTKH